MAQKLGPYLLNRRIGAGGMADIFLAEGPRGVCVIKRPHPQLCANHDFVRMFLDEASLLAQLHHPGIAEIYDLGHDGEVYYLAMEYVPGFDLMTISLEHERQGELIGFDLCARIVADAAAALHYAHDAKAPSGQPLHIIHRDVTPHNILLSTSGEVKLIDFGVAKASTTTHRTQAGLVKGKYPYMSPEQITGQYIDRRVDVYALGLVLYELLTNVRAIAGQTELEQIDNARSAKIRPIEQLRPNTPVPLRQIVASCLFPEVEGRYPTALAVKEDLEKYLAYDHQVVGREDLLRLFRVVAAEVHSELVPTIDGDDFAPSRPTEQEQPISAVVLPEHGTHDEDPNFPGSAPTSPSVRILVPANTRIIGNVRATQIELKEEAGAAPGAGPDDTTEPPNPPPSRLPSVVLGLVLLVAVAGFGAWQWLATPAGPVKAQAEAADAGVLTAFVFPEDAGTEAEAELDAGPATAAVVEVEPSPFVDAGSRSLNGTLHLKCDPQADVLIDRKASGRTPLNLELSAGPHQITFVKAADHFRRTVSVTLDPGETRAINLALKQGTLRIEAVPFATIKLNGETLGATSFKELELYEGTYLVELELADASLPHPVTRKKQVTVKPGERTLVHESMLP